MLLLPSSHLPLLQLCALATELGYESWDVRCLRKAELTGAQLLLLDEAELVAATGLARHKARRLRRLQVGVLPGCVRSVTPRRQHYMVC
jgi:hypothetical protein